MARDQDKLRRTQKAYRIRKRIVGGRNVSADDQAWYDEYSKRQLAAQEEEAAAEPGHNGPLPPAKKPKKKTTKRKTPKAKAKGGEKGAKKKAKKKSADQKKLEKRRAQKQDDTIRAMEFPPNDDYERHDLLLKQIADGYHLSDEERAWFDNFERWVEELSKSVRRIHKAWVGSEHADERLSAVRKEWNQRVGEDKAAVKGVIEADTVSAYTNEKNHLNHIKETWGSLEESEAGRSMNLHDALEEQRKRRAGLKKAMASANQMDNGL